MVDYRTRIAELTDPGFDTPVEAIELLNELVTENEELRRWKALDKPLMAAMNIANSHLAPLRAEIEQLKKIIAELRATK